MIISPSFYHHNYLLVLNQGNRISMEVIRFTFSALNRGRWSNAVPNLIPSVSCNRSGRYLQRDRKTEYRQEQGNRIHMLEHSLEADPCEYALQGMCENEMRLPRVPNSGIDLPRKGVFIGKTKIRLTLITCLHTIIHDYKNTSSLSLSRHMGTRGM